MIIVLLIISYILIGVITGVISFVFIMNKEEDCELAGFFIGMLWPVSIVVYLVYKILAFLVSNVYNICTYIQDEGLHYYKGELSDCCGKCKYIEYCNNYNDINTCKFDVKSRLKCISEPCDKFKKHLFWRFTIRLKN